jgi:hypothetical protein
LVIMRSPGARGEQRRSSGAASARRSPRSPCRRGCPGGVGPARCCWVPQTAGSPTVAGERGLPLNLLVAFETERGPRLCGFADTPAPSCPVLEVMRSPRLPFGMSQSDPNRPSAAPGFCNALTPLQRRVAVAGFMECTPSRLRTGGSTNRAGLGNLDRTIGGVSA